MASTGLAVMYWSEARLAEAVFQKARVIRAAVPDRINLLARARGIQRTISGAEPWGKMVARNESRGARSNLSADGPSFAESRINPTAVLYFNYSLQVASA